ncbi:conjugal transfer protein TraR [Pseudomonas syringae pv. broussonetiae]|uniref:Uncharacterized protein n=1 Tax=Pseudomonas savastanoi TaxID=29438 RepID=A0A3M5JS11_PSESS|nr:hypothetical protein [Pseudomonas savastanoi]KPW62918.1 conjugal transfer protein TraR [Pseudomonas syringae pv. broussonetiae]KWT09442.1 hypothetical protein AL047_16360 [Pseudomonas syringae pv. broussonetiae]RMT25660.1 hypothetical protein ALP51_00771 [Pseudomonas savastanoi]
MKDLTKLKGYTIISEFVEYLEEKVQKDRLKDFLSLPANNMLFLLGIIATKEQEKLIEVYVSII